MKKKDEKITIRCFACDKTQTVRRSKIQKADYYYYCGCGGCKTTGLRPPNLIEEGLAQEWIYNAAGGFDGIKYFKPSPEDLKRFQKAKDILRAGLES